MRRVIKHGPCLQYGPSVLTLYAAETYWPTVELNTSDVPYCVAAIHRSAHNLQTVWVDMFLNVVSEHFSSAGVLTSHSTSQ